MYQQKIKTGEEDVEIFVAGTGAEVPLGIFDLPQLERMSETLDKGHDAVARELYDEYCIDAYTSNQMDERAYA